MVQDVPLLDPRRNLSYRQSLLPTRWLQLNLSYNKKREKNWQFASLSDRHKSISVQQPDTRKILHRQGSATSGIEVEVERGGRWNAPRRLRLGRFSGQPPGSPGCSCCIQVHRRASHRKLRIPSWPESPLEHIDHTHVVVISMFMIKTPSSEVSNY